MLYVILLAILRDFLLIILRNVYPVPTPVGHHNGYFDYLILPFVKQNISDIQGFPPRRRRFHADLFHGRDVL